MAKPRKKLNLNDVLANIKEVLLSLPGVEGNQQIAETIQEIIQELNLLRERIAHFPDRSEREQIAGAANILASFFDSLKDKPLLADALFPKKTKAKKPKGSTVDVNALQQQLELLPTEQILEELTKHKKDTLLELCAKMGITVNKELTKDALADRIFKLGFANRRGYDLLKG